MLADVFNEHLVLCDAELVTFDYFLDMFYMYQKEDCIKQVAELVNNELERRMKVRTGKL